MAPGCDLIAPKMLIELPNSAIEVICKIGTAFDHRCISSLRSSTARWPHAQNQIHLPDYTLKLLDWYLYNRIFAVRCNTTTPDDYIIEAVVPQGSALGPTLFLRYTVDIPTNEHLTTSTFADGTAILSRSRCPGRATPQLANHLFDEERLLSDLGVTINEQKCKHITFTLNRQTCPPLSLNRTQIPQPLFKVELEPDSRVLKKNEVHPIYNLQYLLHRRINVEEPHKRIGPVQCTNCQEYGHTRAYCSLRSVCVACGDFHNSANCPASKEDPKWKNELTAKVTTRQTTGAVRSTRRWRTADPSTVTKHSGSYDGHHAGKYDGIHVNHENDHANTGSKPEHGVTATCR